MILAAIPLTALDWVHLLLTVSVNIGALYGGYRTVLLIIYIVKAFPTLDIETVSKQAISLILQFAIYLVVLLIDIQLGVLFPN